MAETFSFDVTSTVDVQEVKNAVDQTMKEIGQRFDFKGSQVQRHAQGKRARPGNRGGRRLQTQGGHRHPQGKVRQAKRVVESPRLRQGGTSPRRDRAATRHGAKRDRRRESQSHHEESEGEKFKAQAQIQGDQVRVQSKSKDELQTVINFLKQPSSRFRHRPAIRHYR